MACRLFTFQTDTHHLASRSLGTNLSDILVKYHFIQENQFENVASEMVAILYRL